MRRRMTAQEAAHTTEISAVDQDHGDGNETNLTQQGVATIVMRAAMLFLDTPRCYEQLLHWRKEVSKPKIAVCLANTAFVTRLLQDIMKEPGHRVLFECVKAVMNVDHTATRKKGERTPLEVILPQVLSSSSKGAKAAPASPSTSGAHLMSDLVPFVLRQTRLYGIGTNQLPPHVGENLADILVQIWHHMNPQTMPEVEVATLMAAVERLATQWHEAHVSVLVASSPLVPRILHTLQLYIKRALELSVAVLESAEYKTARLLLQELQARLQVEVGAWSRLTSGPLHSALPGPAKIRTAAGSALRPSTASVAAPLANWVKVGPARVRPWSAGFRLASPKARLPLPWKGEIARDSQALEQTLRPLAPEFLASRPRSSPSEPSTARASEPVNPRQSELMVRRMQSAAMINRNLIAYIRRRATAKLAESQRQYFDRVLARSRSTSAALLEDLRYMQAQVGVTREAAPVQEAEEPEAISEEEQDEFRQYLRKAGIR